MTDNMSYGLLDNFAWQESVNRHGNWNERGHQHMMTDEENVQKGLEKAAKVHGYWLH